MKMKRSFKSIIDEVYDYYLETHFYEPFILTEEMNLTKEEFIGKVTNNYGFGFLFGINIVERLLTLEERRQMVSQDMFNQIYNGGEPESLSHSEINQWDVPTKKITILYKGENIEIYE